MPLYETVCHSAVRQQDVPRNSRLLHKDGFIWNLALRLVLYFQISVLTDTRLYEIRVDKRCTF